jgi:hypothetical protein
MHTEYAHIGDIEWKVVEEVVELLQSLAKIKRFGIDSHHPDRPDSSNRRDALVECNDVILRVEELKGELIYRIGDQ